MPDPRPCELSERLTPRLMHRGIHSQPGIKVNSISAMTELRTTFRSFRDCPPSRPN